MTIAGAGGGRSGGVTAAGFDRRPPGDSLSLPALAWKLLTAWSRQLLALAAAAAVVAATVAGALGVGDSLTGGLERLALARLGGITAAVVADEPFSVARAADVEPPLLPSLVLAVSLESTAERPRAAPATLLACDDPGRLGFDPPPPAVPAGGIVINAPLALALGVTVGDAVVLRVAAPADVPADLPLGRRDGDPVGRRVRVAAILPAAGIGQFSLRPAQVTGGLALVPLDVAQAMVQRDDAANVLFAVADAAPAPRDHDLVARLREAVRPTLADLGLTLEPVGPGGVPRLTSRRLVLSAEVDRAAARVLTPVGGRPSLAFLAVGIDLPAEAGRPAASVPYSTVLGIDQTDLPVGRLVDDAGQPLAVPGDEEIVITRWAADDLAAQGHPATVGTWVLVRSFLPETLHGRVAESTTRLRIAGIAAQSGPAVARDLVPDVRGVTDEASIADWDPPFPFDRSRVRSTPPDDIDDRYWKLHGAAPKAFVSLATARTIAGSRFGGTTAWHLPAAAAADAPRLREQLAAAIRPAAMGFTVESLRADALAAARGSTPFGGLFIALSGFVVIAGLILEWLLFSLLVAAHRRDVGLLSALGWPPGRLATLVTLVAAPAALAGTLVGVVAGPLWTRLLLAWRGGAWDKAVAAGSSAVFSTAGVRPATLVTAALVAGLLSLAALAVAARRTARRDPLGLLRGTGTAGTVPAPAGGWLVPVSTGLLFAGAAVAWLAGRSDAAAAVGMFFLAGVLCLAGLLGLVRSRVAALAAGRLRPLGSLWQLAGRGLAHGPGRAFSVAAMVAVAEFLVVAVSAFRLDDRPATDRSGPTGGWTTLATFGTPTSIDPADTAVRGTLGLTAAEARALEGCEVALVRSSGGDDASCTNLYASVRPVVHGVGPAFVARGGFRFTAMSEPVANPWRLLEADVAETAPLPAILDAATAQWALKLGGLGAEFDLPDATGTPVRLRIVGLLEPGILQGAVIVSERSFARLFPRGSGYSLALASAPPGADPDAFAAGLATAWADAGVTLEPATDRLRRLQAVQNTFLAGFQALGALGLLLGTAGVAAVQIQGVVERAGTFGLLGALGFDRRRIALLVVLETVLMVSWGLLAGGLAGALALPRGVAGGSVHLPLGWLALTCLLTLAVACLAGWLAARRAVRVGPREALAGG
jgi:ABC-type lipoprotein release transport system permease subunit